MGLDNNNEVLINREKSLTCVKLNFSKYCCKIFSQIKKRLKEHRNNICTNSLQDQDFYFLLMFHFVKQRFRFTFN